MPIDGDAECFYDAIVWAALVCSGVGGWDCSACLVAGSVGGAVSIVLWVSMSMLWSTDQEICWLSSSIIVLSRIIFLTNNLKALISHFNFSSCLPCFMCVGVESWGWGLLLKQSKILLAKDRCWRDGCGDAESSGWCDNWEEECCWYCVDGDDVWAVLVCSDSVVGGWWGCSACLVAGPGEHSAPGCHGWCVSLWARDCGCDFSAVESEGVACSPVEWGKCTCTCVHLFLSLAYFETAVYGSVHLERLTVHGIYWEMHAREKDCDLSKLLTWLEYAHCPLSLHLCVLC